MALINATNEAAKKTKTDVYSGTAEIVEANAVDARWTKDLSDEDAASAFDIELKVKPESDTVGQHTIYIPFTKRVPSFSKDGKTEADLAVENLSRQGLVENNDITTVLNAKGKKCQVWIYDETSAKGTFRRAQLSNGRPKLSQADVLKKLAMLTGKSAAPAPAANPFA